jgi:hypothetical protein
VLLFLSPNAQKCARIFFSRLADYFPLLAHNKKREAGGCSLPRRRPTSPARTPLPNRPESLHKINKMNDLHRFFWPKTVL